MVPQVLLQHSDAIARVVEFYRVDGKGISEPVWTVDRQLKWDIHKAIKTVE